MKTKLTFFLLLAALPMFAQVQSGSLLFDGSAALEKPLNGSGDAFRFSLAPQAGYLLTDRLMLGLGLRYAYDRYGDDSNIAGYTLSPFARYYLTPNTRWNFFLQGTYNYFHQIWNDILFESETRFSQVNLGAGANYFLNANVAVEGILQYEIIFGEGKPTHSIGYNGGLQFFLPPTADATSAGTAVQRGNRLIGLNFSGGWINLNDANNDFASLSIQPTLGFFVTDRLVLGSGLFLGFAEQNTIVEPQPLARYYWGSRESVLQPFAGVTLGTRFQFADKSSEPSFFNLNARAGMGLDVFLTPVVALEGQLLYNVRQLEDANFKYESLLFNVGFQFFLQR